MHFRYPIYKPKLGLSACFAAFKAVFKSKVSGKPEVVENYEKKLSQALNLTNLILVSNGTLALNVAIRTLDLPKASKILIPEIGYIAVANTVVDLGYEPVICPVDPETLQIDLQYTESIISKCQITAIIVIHNYGLVCDLNKLVKLCTKYKVFLIEDCAEAIGSKFENTNVGNFGDCATFSFFANKLITSGEGGAVTFKNKNHVTKAKKLINQGIKNKLNMTTNSLGFNFRMSGILASVLAAQIESIGKLNAKKLKILDYYKFYLNSEKIKFQASHTKSSKIPWLVNIKFESKNKRDSCMSFLLENNIETRKIFPPIDQKFYGSHLNYTARREALRLYETWLSLPSYPELKRKDIRTICKLILKSI